ncbi:MAG: hypothetical protein Q8M26_14790 [Pseudolabrys sp.]|nr:hypothetical protein [Pseudolabrys sp.]
MNRRPISFNHRDALIAQAYSAAECWFVVSAGALFTLLAGQVWSV